MNKYVKTIIGVLIVIIPAALLVGYLFNRLAQKSFYKNSGNIHVTGINSQVKIYSDEYGVPHIIASNEHDMYFALGYMHAQDRLWQMDLTRRVAEGRLSEIFGSSTLDFDKLFRTIGIGKYCYNLRNKISPKSKEILDAYSDGVNKFIEMHYNDLPAEFDILNYKPDKWKPEHSLMIIRMMGWEVNLSWFTDYVMGEIIDKAGIEKISGIFPDSTMSLYKKVQTEQDTTSADSLKPVSINIKGAKLLREMTVLGQDFFESNRDYRRFFNLSFDHSGSNCWVVSGQRSESGKPILANDPHLVLMAPSRWYEVHLKDRDMDVTGMSLAGVPGIAIGHNRVICWGITNLMNDDNDFIVFDKVPSDKIAYKYKDKILKMDSVTEKIQVKDSAEIYYTIRYTISGPVISGLKKRGLIDSGNESDAYSNKVMTFKWTGFEISDEIFSFYKINHAKDREEFINGLKNFGTPALNFVYADTSGNIGYKAAGLIPERRTASFGYIYPSTDELEWTGFVEFDRMPSVFNPTDGFIATANTNPFDWMRTEPKNRFYISYEWAPSSRLDRIDEYLKLRKRYNYDELKLLQLSDQSPYAKSITSFILGAFKNYSTNDAEINQALGKFRKWDYNMDSNDPMGAIFNVFLVKLIKNFYLDKFGEKAFEDFLMICNLPLNMTLRVLSDTNSGWFNQTGSDYAHRRDYVIRQSFIEALEYLNARYNNTVIDSWRWGDLHKVIFTHPLGSVSILEKSFNIGPYDIGGDQTTVNNSTYNFVDAYRNGTYIDVVGPSMRMITDLADMDHTYSINSTGQSGQPIHPNYEDQSRLWLYGDYKTVVMNESEFTGDRYKLMILIP
jgi:penicillin amidase